MKKTRYFLTLLLIIFVTSAFAQDESLGELSEQVLVPIGYLSNIFNYVCWIVGTALVLSGVIQYKGHRKNPVQVRLSRVIVFWILGLFLIALPFIGHLAGVTFLPEM